MLCIMWNSKHFWLQVNRTSSAYNLYRRNSMEDFAKSLKYVYLRIILWIPLFLEFFASHSICTTGTWVSSRWVKFVDEVGSTIFDWNSDCIFATVRTITKADLPFNFIIFYCRMSIIQPTWPVCTTSVCWHTHFWYFCSGSSHQTILSPKKPICNSPSSHDNKNRHQLSSHCYISDAWRYLVHRCELIHYSPDLFWS